MRNAGTGRTAASPDRFRSLVRSRNWLTQPARTKIFLPRLGKNQKADAYSRCFWLLQPQHQFFFGFFFNRVPACFFEDCWTNTSWFEIFFLKSHNYCKSEDCALLGPGGLIDPTRLGPAGSKRRARHFPGRVGLDPIRRKPARVATKCAHPHGIISGGILFTV